VGGGGRNCRRPPSKLRKHGGGGKSIKKEGRLVFTDRPDQTGWQCTGNYRRILTATQNRKTDVNLRRSLYLQGGKEGKKQVKLENGCEPGGD